jgi:hypothetical protein
MRRLNARLPLRELTLRYAEFVRRCSTAAPAQLSTAMPGRTAHALVDAIASDKQTVRAHARIQSKAGC